MKLSKVACNATNSLAVNPKSELLVWGSGKHGLLGNGYSAKSAPKPIVLPLTRSGTPDDIFSKDGVTKFKVDDIAIGHQHVCVVAHDADLDTYGLEHQKHSL